MFILKYSIVVLQRNGYLILKLFYFLKHQFENISRESLYKLLFNVKDFDNYSELNVNIRKLFWRVKPLTGMIKHFKMHIRNVFHCLQDYSFFFFFFSYIILQLWNFKLYISKFHLPILIQAMSSHYNVQNILLFIEIMYSQIQLKTRWCIFTHITRKWKVYLIFIIWLLPGRHSYR